MEGKGSEREGKEREKEGIGREKGRRVCQYTAIKTLFRAGNMSIKQSRFYTPITTVLYQ